MKNIKKGLIICGMVCVSLFLFCFLLIGTVMVRKVVMFFLYDSSVSKADVFEMLNSNQEEFEDMVEKMQTLYNENEKYIIELDTKREFESNNLNNVLLKKYSIRSISVKKKETYLIVKFNIKYPPKPNLYGGIYYKEDGLPSTWGKGELEEIDGIYVQEGSYFKYKTEKIKDNWFYYECWCR